MLILEKKIRDLLMKIKLKNVNGVNRFTFITEELLVGKKVEVVGVKSLDKKVYHIVFYNKTDKEFYGYITKSAKEMESGKNVVFQKES